MFLLLFIIIRLLSAFLLFPVFFLSIFLCIACAFHSLPPHTHTHAVFGSFLVVVVVAVAIVLTLSLRQVSNVAEWPTPSSSSLPSPSPAVSGSSSRLLSALSALHFVHFSGGLFALAAKCLVAWCRPCASPIIPLAANTISLCYVFCLFCIICCLRLLTLLCPAVALLRSPTNFAYIYSDIFQPSFVVVVHIL